MVLLISTLVDFLRTDDLLLLTTLLPGLSAVALTAVGSFCGDLFVATKRSSAVYYKEHGTVKQTCIWSVRWGNIRKTPA